MINWQTVGDEAVQILSRYLQINTTNPPGNERQAVEFLATLLRERGLEPKLYASAPGRANLLARLPGDGSAGAIILLHHMDVVSADPARWSCAPFGGEIRDGYVWGRGAIDMKGVGVMHLLALDLLRRSNTPRKRDLIYLAVADEEMGSTHGAQWMLTHHWPEIEAEYVWDEGGFGLRDFFGPGVVFAVAVAEKQALWLRLCMPWPGCWTTRLPCICTKSHGPCSPGSPRCNLSPSPYSCVTWAIHWPSPWRGNRLPPRPRSTPYCATPSASLSSAPGTRRTSSPSKPRRCSTCATTISAYDSALFRAIAEVTARLVPGSITVPMLTPGATDSCFFRRKGINTYGLFPAIITPEELAGFHGIDERISLENLQLGTRIIYEVLSEVL
jgi:acetylornithine deacetylase/succinyl-diaminopimelate desuccinylase-like protein